MIDNYTLAYKKMINEGITVEKAVDLISKAIISKRKDAQKLKNVSWKDFRKIVGNKWSPGLSMPFDPIASQKAEQLNLKVIIANGKKLKNLKNCLEGKKFKGTVIK